MYLEHFWLETNIRETFGKTLTSLTLIPVSRLFLPDLLCSRDLTKHWDNIVVGVMVTDMEVDMVADMELDKVADKVADIVVDRAADKKKVYKAWNVLKQSALGRSCLMRSVSNLRVF